MISLTCDLKTKLETILPTYFELFVDANSTVPCITLMPASNSAEEEGDTIRYATQSYLIKVWGDSVGTVETYAQQIDEVLFSSGYKREGLSVLTNNNLVCYVLKYMAHTIEK